MSETVIKVENLSKQYDLGVIGRDTLVKELQSWWALKRGKPDPNDPVVAEDEGLLDGNRLWALQDVSFEVKQGEILGIIGKNGAGKSTLLKILTKVTIGTSGVVKIKGRVASLLEVGTGFHPELTGRENIYLNGTILGMNKAEINRKFDEIVDFAEVERFIDTPVKRYSSGMHVRLAFAVAAHLEPEIMLVDEVLAVGDAAFQKKCLGKMGTVAGEGRTVLFVSHNMGAVSSLCTRAILLEKGMIVDSGETSEVINTYISKLSGSESREAERFFTDTPEKPAQIRRICISDPDGNPSLIHGILNPIRVEIDFVIRQHFPNLFVACTVRTIMDQIIFTTNEMDWINYSETRMKGVFPKAPGYYKASVVIPAPMLQPGKYELQCPLTVSDPRIGDVECQRGIFIEIADFGGSFANFPIKHGGLLAFPLQWQVQISEN
ncbi:MAG: ABC transporter ATP-binding protein [Desulfobacterales bacterium]|nr:ABC transporter ATP-binding protein [Desulfobacterales bacterium]